MNTATVVADTIGLIGFFVVMVLTLSIKSASPLITRPVRIVFALAMGIYVLVGASNVLEHTGVTPMFDPFEDYQELLFMPGIAWVATTVSLNHQIDVRQQLVHAMSAQNNLLLSIVDTVPGGVVVLDPAGGISFANQGAERILGLRSDTQGTLHLTPSWILRDPVTGIAMTLRDIANLGEIVRRPYLAEWPDRQSTALTLSATAMASSDGSPGGSVVAFEELGSR